MRPVSLFVACGALAHPQQEALEPASDGRSRGSNPFRSAAALLAAPPQDGGLTHDDPRVTKLNSIFREGHPTNNMAKAGLLVHMFDDRRLTWDTPWIPCATEACGNGTILSTSLINAKIRKVRSQLVSGVVLSPGGKSPKDHPQVRCSHYMDTHSERVGCEPERQPQLAVWDPVLQHQTLAYFPPDSTKDMLELSERFQKLEGAENATDRWNDVIVSASHYVSKLPTSVAAFLVTMEADEWAVYATTTTYCDFLQAYQLNTYDMPFVILDLSWAARDQPLKALNVRCDGAQPGTPGTMPGALAPLPVKSSS